MRTLIASIMLATSMASGIVSAQEPPMLDGVTVMALGALDGRAVVKTADGKMQVLKLGDKIAGTNAIVSQILADKLVVEETLLRTGEEPKRQTVWITKPAKAGDKSTIQRLSSDAPAQQISVHTVANPVAPKK